MVFTLLFLFTRRGLLVGGVLGVFGVPGVAGESGVSGVPGVSGVTGVFRVPAVRGVGNESSGFDVCCSFLTAWRTQSFDSGPAAVSPISFLPFNISMLLGRS